MKKIFFLNLTAFSQTGGIERFNKCFLKALSELDTEGVTDSRSYSAYDKTVNGSYYGQADYRGFNKNKRAFVLQSVLEARKYDVIILGHINLAVLGLLIKALYPTKKMILVTHGIDVWGALSSLKTKILHKADGILSVSNFTKNKLKDIHGIEANKIQVFHNTIDPYFSMPDSVSRVDDLRQRYSLTSSDFVIYTLTRLSHTELYKGYDKVLAALSSLVKTNKAIKYVIGGKYDAIEKARIDSLILEYDLDGHVVLTGYLDEQELVAHYQMADVYIMPSKKEGFGIVFIEALVSGLPVIAGNADGSVDALLNGKTGTLVNPDSISEIEAALLQALGSGQRSDEAKLRANKKETLDNFSFASYKKRLRDIITAC